MAVVQPRQLARELALITLGQISNKAALQTDMPMEDLMAAAVRVLIHEAQNLLATASQELSNGNDRLLHSEINANKDSSSGTMVAESIVLTQTAINRVAMALELPEIVQIAGQEATRSYALEISRAVRHYRDTIDSLLNEAMVDWQLGRLPRIDQDILRIAIAEIKYLGQPRQVAINQAVELAKRYSDEEGKRLINGVLRKTVEAMDKGTTVPEIGPVSRSSTAQ
jgi:transcription antitermination protein NusB